MASRRDLLLTVIGGVEMFLGLALNRWPDMAVLAWGVIAIGLVSVLAGAWGLLGGWLVQKIPAPLSAPDWYWSRAAWTKYKPTIQIEHLSPTQDDADGKRTVSRLEFTVIFTAHYPYGPTTLGPGQSFALVQQNRRTYRFHHSAANSQVVKVARGSSYRDIIVYESDDLNRPLHDAPDLDRSFTWHIYKLGAVLYGARSFTKFFSRSFKGRREGIE